MSANIPYNGGNNLQDYLKDYFRSESEAFQYLVIKKRQKENVGLIIHDTHNEVFKREQIGVVLPDVNPPPQKPVAKLVAPQSVGTGALVILDASGSSNYDNLEIIQPEGQNIPLIQLGSNKWQFTAGTEARDLSFQAKATKGQETSIANVTVKIVTTPPPQNEIDLNPYIIAVSASKDDGNVPANVKDGDINTRWSAEGAGNYLELKFNQIIRITKLRIAFYKGNTRQTNFTFNAQNFRSSGKSNDLEEFPLSSEFIGDTARIVFNGNSSNTWNSITEVKVLGYASGSPPPPPPDCPAGQKYNPVTGQCEDIVVEPPPPEPTGGETLFMSIGDNDVTSGSKQVYTAMKKVYNQFKPVLTNKSIRLIHAGDTSYSGEAKTWTSIHSQHWTAEEKEIWRVSKGNHDCNSSEKDQTQLDLESYFPRYKPESPVSSPRKNLWTEFEVVNNVAFINMDSEDLDVEFQRDQFKWVKDEIVPKVKQLRSEGKIDWVVVAFHKPFFTLKSSHSPYVLVRYIYKDLFAEMEVDVILHGHNHNAQLWYPMIPNATQTNGEGQQLFEYASDGKTFNFAKKHGWLTVINGHSGHEDNFIDDSGNGVKNVMWYGDGKTGIQEFGFSKLLFKGKRLNVQYIGISGKTYYEYNATRDGSTNPPPPPEGEAKAVLNVPSNAGVNQTIVADASQSLADNVEITETSSNNIQMTDVGKWKKQFVTPDKASYSIGLQAKATKGTKQSIVQKSIQVTKGNQPPPTNNIGKLIFNSNDYWKTGKKETVTGKWGNQTFGGFYTAASGNPSAIIDGDGVIHLRANKGHGRLYHLIKNYNVRMEIKCMFEDMNIDNMSFKLRSRHGEGGAGENRYGGYGGHISLKENIAGLKSEKFHNEHDSGIEKSLPTKLELKKWFDVAVTIKTSADNKSVTAIFEYDPNGNKQWKEVCRQTLNNVPSYYVDKNKFMQNSYLWTRINNETTGQVAFKDMMIYDLDQSP